MKKYVIHNGELGYFKSGNSGSLWYNESDFVPTIEKAYWFATREFAEKRAISLLLGQSEIHSVVVPIEVTIEEETPEGVDKLLKNTILEYRKLVEETDALSDKEVEALPNAKWEKYRHAKRFVQDYGYRIDQL